MYFFDRWRGISYNNNTEINGRLFDYSKPNGRRAYFEGARINKHQFEPLFIIKWLELIIFMIVKQCNNPRPISVHATPRIQW